MVQRRAAASRAWAGFSLPRYDAVITRRRVPNVVDAYTQLTEKQIFDTVPIETVFFSQDKKEGGSNEKLFFKHEHQAGLCAPRPRHGLHMAFRQQSACV